MKIHEREIPDEFEGLYAETLCLRRRGYFHSDSAICGTPGEMVRECQSEIVPPHLTGGKARETPVGGGVGVGGKRRRIFQTRSEVKVFNLFVSSVKRECLCVFNRKGIFLEFAYDKDEKCPAL